MPDLRTASLRLPAKSKLPRLEALEVEWRGRWFSLPYLYREGSGGPSVLFVHGLGGAKEDFHAAFQSQALSDCTLLAFDEPGTGLAEFYPEAGLDVSALAGITHRVADRLLPGPYWLVGASMGGLISLLQIRNYGLGRIQGLVSLEGNLCAEDCMFSRRVIPHTLDSFSAVYERMIQELRVSAHAGDRIVAHNMELNVDIRAYHAYSFETVKESDSGRLLEEFIGLQAPKLFVYGEQNKTLSYLARLHGSDVRVQEAPSSAHFMFYDNPAFTFKAIGEFVHGC